LLSVNIIAPVTYGWAVVNLRYDVNVLHHQESRSLKWIEGTASILTGVFQIVSGLILVSTVISIRRFFRKKNETEFINTGMLWRHALTFGLYLLGAIGYFGSFVFVILYPTNPAVFNTFETICLFFWPVQLVSEILLCTIFWDLGKKKVNDTNEERGRPMSVHVEDFDEDAEL
jgi:hypothetical protein